MAMSIADQQRDLANGGKVTRRQWLTLSLVRHGSRVAPWTHATFNDLQALGLVQGVAMHGRNNRLLLTRRWNITEAGLAAYARMFRA